MKRAVVRTLLAATLLAGLSGVLSGGAASASSRGCRYVGKGSVCYGLGVHSILVGVRANAVTLVVVEVDPIPLYGAGAAVFTNPQAIGAGFVCVNGRYAVIYGNPYQWTLRYTPINCRATSP